MHSPACSVEDRERRFLAPTDVGSYSPGITRVERVIKTKLEEHDRQFDRETDPDIWQVGYSLRKHCQKLARLMLKIGHARRRSERDIMLGYTSALFHDAGKLHESCHAYRRNKVLTPEEKAPVDRHAEYSGQMILDCLPLVRVEDRPFILDAYPIIRFHHKPECIEAPSLREIAFDIMYSDTLLAMMENRHRPGLSQFQAADKLLEVAELHKRDPRRAPFSSEIDASCATIHRLYGFVR